MSAETALAIYPETREQAIERVGLGAGQIVLGENAQLHLATIEARGYQIDTWHEISEAREAGKDKVLVHLATGLGKTTVGVMDALSFIDHEFKQTGQVPRVLFTCHQNEILEQAAERFMDLAPALTQGSYADGKKELDGGLTFATLQSLNRDLHKIDPEQFDYIIYDEAHHMQAETFKQVVEHFKPKFQMALTATPERMDEERIEELFGEPIYSKSLGEAMTEGYLANVDYHIVFDDAVRKAMEMGFDPKTLQEIRKLLRNESRNDEIANQIKRERERIGLQDAKTIVFCQNIEQSEQMAELLNGKAYHSGLRKHDRRNALAEFKRNDLQILTTRDMFNEGVDIPDARLLVFLRSTSSRTVFEQQLGRGLRKSAEKDTVSVLDFVANIERLGQVKQLTDQIIEYTPRRDSGSIQSTEIIVDVTDDSSGLQIHTNHTDFDFEKLSIMILDKLQNIRVPNEGLDLSNEELIKLALDLSPRAALGVGEVKELSKLKIFVSEGTIRNRFGSFTDFHTACGFNRPKASNMTNEEIVELALSISPDKPLTENDVERLHKDALFIGKHPLTKRFGSYTDFHIACGFRAIGKASKMTDEEIISLALSLSPDKALIKPELMKLSREGSFFSPSIIRKRFGSLANFQKACGFGTKPLE